MERKSLYKGRLDFGLEVADLPNGERIALEIVRHPGGSVIAAVDSEQKLCVIKQFRHAVDQWIWELPAGVLDAGEDPLTAAKRELTEETGVSAELWQSLGAILSTPGFCDEELHLYLAQNLSLGKAKPEQGELIETHWLPISEVVEKVLSGEITDAKTIVAVLRAQDVLSAVG